MSRQEPAIHNEGGIMRIIISLLLPILLVALTGGCTVKVPTIAHTHIGHTITAWQDTPDRMGLLVVAEKKAQEASEHAGRASTEGSDIDVVKSAVSKVLIATDPQSTRSTAIKVGPPYGLKQALTGAIDHITFAANSDDATANMRNFAVEFDGNSVAVIERCDLITVLGEDISASSSFEEADILAQEIFSLTQANLSGVDSDGNGVVGSSPEEYGLRQLRSELDAMLAREDPPYSTVNRWYVLNLIQLPTGEWAFKERSSDSGGGGGGGY